MKELFTWDKVPGQDDELLLDFLKETLSADWVENAQIKKIDNGEALTISSGKDLIEIRLDKDRENATLRTSDRKTIKLVVREKYGELKIKIRKEPKSRAGRVINVYFKSTEEMDLWKEFAKAHGSTNLSDFIILTLQATMNPPELPEESPSQIIARLRAENNELKQQIEISKEENYKNNRVIKDLKKESMRLRSEPFKDKNFLGTKDFEPELIKYLKANKMGGTETAILNHLGIEPADVELVKVISEQINLLEWWGLVRMTTRGWRWQG